MDLPELPFLEPSSFVAKITLGSPELGSIIILTSEDLFPIEKLLRSPVERFPLPLPAAH